MNNEPLIQIVSDLRSDTTLLEQVTRCWLDVSNDGGAVGFPFLPVSYDEVALAAERLAADVANGEAVLFVAHLDSDLVGWVLLRLNKPKLTAHWAIIQRLQSHPTRRGIGIGAALLAAAVAHAEVLGLTHLHLAVRSGEGLESYYQRRGWKQTGRHPLSLRLSSDDTRDEIQMTLNLRPADNNPEAAR